MNRSFHSRQLAAASGDLCAGDFEGVLHRARELLRNFGTPPFPLPFAGGLPKVDWLLDALGRKLHENRERTSMPRTGGDWILATCVYETGGHTPVMRDLASALPGGIKGLVLTLTGHDSAELTDRAVLRTGLPAEAVRRADAPSLWETCQNVVRILGREKPERIFLFQYPDDTVAVAAAAALAAAGTEIWLVHHADGYPTAGLFLPGLRILDLTPTACAFTRHVLGLPSIWLPVTCPDPGLPPPEFLRRGHLTTALSGSLFKTSQQPPVSYPEALNAVLRVTRGAHVHVGPLRKDLHDALLQAVSVAGLPPDRLIHVPVAPSLAGVLREQGVDLLLNTWPAGGARATVEAMASGVPVLWQSAHETVARFSIQMAYPGAGTWCHLSDLAALIAGADLDWLKAQSQVARRHFELRHHPSRWREFFQNDSPDAALPLPEGFDASGFLPALWNTLLDLALDTHDSSIADLRARWRKQHEKLKEFAPLKQRIRALESELQELRFPWIVRLWRRWSRKSRAGENDHDG